MNGTIIPALPVIWIDVIGVTRHTLCHHPSCPTSHYVDRDTISDPTNLEDCDVISDIGNSFSTSSSLSLSVPLLLFLSLSLSLPLPLPVSLKLFHVPKSKCKRIPKFF